MKMHKKKKIVGIILGISLLFVGCKFGKTAIVFTSGLGSKDVFHIGGTVCSLTQAKVYLCNYQNIYGNSYGVNLWEHTSADDSLEEYVKDITIAELARVICMDELAKKEEISLTDDELSKVSEAASTYYESLSEAEITYMDVNKSDIKGLYKEYALAQKLYNSLTESVNEEVSDDEARIIEAMQIVVTDKEKADEVQSELNQGKDFLAVASNYNEAANIEITFGRGDIPSQVEKVAFELDDDEISSCITTDDGFYFIKCTNKFNEELTDANKKNIVKKREKEAFEDVYDEFVDGLSSNINENLWDSVKVDQDDAITTNSFFKVYDEYFTK